jgi:hypothetical protein
MRARAGCPVPDELEQLAGLIRVRNDIDRSIAALIGRPAGPGNIGEFVAARIFAITLVTSGSHPGYDGVFREGALTGKTVNIKTYSRHESVLDISPHPCDFYLVLTGPPGQARVLPWVIDSVFLFEHDPCWPRCGNAGSRSASPPASGKPTGTQPGSSPRIRHLRCSCRHPSSPRSHPSHRLHRDRPRHGGMKDRADTSPSIRRAHNAPPPPLAEHARA